MGHRISTEQRWRELVMAQQSSGTPPVKYCREENICRTSFYAWRKRLGMANAPAAPAVSVSKGFMRLRPPTTEVRGIRIETPNGYCVQTWPMGEDGLRNVLEMLRGL